MKPEELIKERVRHYFWDLDIQCARTSMLCLAELFGITIEPQTVTAAIGMAGAGCYRGQCGLVEGSLMFLGVYFAQKGKTDKEIYQICYRFANEFTRKFGSLRCYDLRPNGFTPLDPPCLCERFAVEAITFGYEYVNYVLELDNK